MPKVYLTTAQREQAQERDRNEVLAIMVRCHKAKDRKNDSEFGELVGISKATVNRYKDADQVGQVKLNDLRRMFKALNVSKEDALRILGY